MNLFLERGMSFFVSADQSVSAQPWISQLHLTADFFAAIAYFLILVTLFRFLRRREDLQHRGAFSLWLVFLLAAVCFHASELLAPSGFYGLAGLVKGIFSFFSFLSAVVFWKLLPKALELPGPGDFEQIHRDLNDVILERDRRIEKFYSEQQSLRQSLDNAIAQYQQTRQQLSEMESQRRQEAVLFKSQEEKLVKLTENPYALTLLLSHTGRVLWASAACESLLRMTFEELQGRDAFDFLHPEDSFRARKIFAAGLASPRWSKEFQFRILHRDGTYRTFQISGVNTLQDKVLQGVLLYLRDVSETKRFEEYAFQLPALMREVSESVDFHQALEKTMKGLCGLAGWDYAEAWLPRTDEKFLECCSAWFGDENFKALRSLSQDLRIPPRVSIQGHVWSEGRAFWVEDVNLRPDTMFFRADVLKKSGIQSALGVPVLVEDKTLAVLVFFKKGTIKKRLASDPVRTMAEYLGAVMRQKLADEQRRMAYEQVEKKIQEKTQELNKAKEQLQSDLTQHLLIEDSLRKSEENAQTLINSLDGIVWEFDLADLRFTFVNQRAEVILGYPMGVWLSEPLFWREHVHGSDRDGAVAFRQRVADQKKSDCFEYRMITADGKTLWFRDMVTVVVKEGKAVKLRGVMVNITESKLVEEALYQERNFVSTVLDTASALVMILDSQGCVQRFNRACLHLSGYSLEEVQGRCFWDLFVRQDEKNDLKGVFARLLAGQFPTNYESSLIAKSGHTFEVAWTSTVLFKKDGSIAHIIVTGIDITQRKQIERKLTETVADLARSNQELDRSSKELTEANEQLKSLDEVKSHFISAASHELRTPLTSIKGFVETILQNEAGPINEQQREFLGHVKESTDRLHRLLNELLDISKIESGQVEMNRELTNLRELLSEEAALFRGMADKKNISLDLETDLHLKEIFCDQDKIREVIGNLLSNAVKYTPRGGHVKVLACNSDQGVVIDVEDTGIGIRQDDLIRVFEPFQHIQKDGAEDEESTGLGLTLVKRIVEAHGGEVYVKSESGKGSVFSVHLPVGKFSSGSQQKSWAVNRE